jgi:hypothetical protein
MSKVIITLMAVAFLLTAVGSAFGETEDEIIARYLKKTEKKHKSKLGYFSAYYSYGKLSDKSDYNKFANYADFNIVGGNYVQTITRSNQIGACFGLMVTPSVALKLGFEYWDKLGSNINDYESKVQIYGFSLGCDYYILNAPHKDAYLPGIAPRLGLTGGLYITKWDIWDGLQPFNLTTGVQDIVLANENAGPMNGVAPGITATAGVDIPTPVWDMVIGTDISYLYLNFSKVKAYNSVDDELYVSYTASADDRVNLDFSGFRGKVEIRKFFRW